MKASWFATVAFLIPTWANSQNESKKSPGNVAMFRGNSEHTGVYAGAGVPQFHSIKWKFHAGGYVISSPAVDSGAAYLGSTNGMLYAVDLATGKERWKFPTEARVTSSPEVSGGVVYFASYDGKFYAVDAATGKLKWKFQTAGEHRFTEKHLHGSLPEAKACPTRSISTCRPCYR